MTDPSIKSGHRKNKSRQMTMMMTPVKAQDDSPVAPRRALQGTGSMSRWEPTIRIPRRVSNVVDRLHQEGMRVSRVTLSWFNRVGEAKNSCRQ